MGARQNSFAISQPIHLYHSEKNGWFLKEEGDIGVVMVAGYHDLLSNGSRMARAANVSFYAHKKNGYIFLGVVR